MLTNSYLPHQKHARRYPTVARIALNVIPIQATSVPCERLFSASKQDADQLRASIGPLRFEQVQVLKYRWRANAVDFARANNDFVEVCTIGHYQSLLADDNELARLDAMFVPKP